MRTVGLIVEYNPLHNGHVYHMEQAKLAAAADTAVCVMSGHFLQRGEPAIVNKWARAEMALAAGADLVIELPAAFSSQPAEWFAYGAVSALEASGVVDAVCFGSESGRIDWMVQAADAVYQEPEVFQRLLKAALSTGLPYPAAYSHALAQYIPELQAEELSKPNNTLGLHYLIAMRRLSSSMKPVTITRTRAEYHQADITDLRIASATALRKLLASGESIDGLKPYVPKSTMDILEREILSGRAPIDWESFARPLLHIVLSSSTSELASYAEAGEGIEHRIKRAASQLSANRLPGEGSIEVLLRLLKTKRYTRTKLQRLLLHILLNHRKASFTAERLQDGVPYLRVLGFSARGQQLLRRMKQTAKVPVILKASSHNSDQLTFDIQASSVYALAYDSAPDERELLRDYFQSPIVL